MKVAQGTQRGFLHHVFGSGFVAQQPAREVESSVQPRQHHGFKAARVAHVKLLADQEPTLHFFMSIAAEVVAQKIQRARRLRLELDARDAAGNQVGANPEIGHVEPVNEVERAYREHDALAKLQRDLVRRELEAPRHDLDLSWRLGRGAARDQRADQRRSACGEGARESAATRQQAHWSTTGNSVSSKSVPPASASISRQPSPLYGAPASQGKGVRLSCEPGAGNGKISDLAEWWAMCPVMWWCSWWMWP